MRALLSVVALVLVGACGSGQAPAAQAAPETVVAQLMRALDDGSCPTVKSLVVTPSEVECGLVESAAGSFADEGIDLEDTLYGAGPVRGTSVTVTIRWGNDMPDESYDLEQVDGSWKVVFDSAA